MITIITKQKKYIQLPWDSAKEWLKQGYGK